MKAIPEIRLFVFDHDGVLTDGSIVTNDRGEESKRYHVRDGLGVVTAGRMGLLTAVITGRSTRGVRLRVRELGIPWLLQGISDKAEALRTICDAAGIAPQQTAFMGDDVIDLPAMRLVGFSIAVADAVDAVRREADYVTRALGGRGAVREAIELLLSRGGRWVAEMSRRYPEPVVE
ncbi:MAG: HAD-IIIA family hydrolase [Phycisphaeraceae bacterium]|nr:HAD-IIIA family hydrolase [Phycisphaeraceae bacterium]